MRSCARSTGLSSSVFAVAMLLGGAASAQTTTWTAKAQFDGGTLNNASSSKLPNAVVLGPTPVSQTRLVWSDNFNYGFVVRLDSVTGKQTSRFDSVLNTINGVSTGVRPANEFCNWGGTGNCPGRVAVDSNGDVWIVNRAFAAQGSLSKFSGNIAHCIDRNNNGVIDTSADKNNDGIIDMNPASGEYFGQNDECILTTIPIGAVGDVPRGVAVDKWGKIWVSTFYNAKLYRFNPAEPVTLETTITLPAAAHPYSMATGGDYLFVSNNTAGTTYRVHVTTSAVDTAPCPTSYGVVADPGGQVAWLGTWGSGNGIYRADFNTHTCALLGSTSGGATTAVTLDTQPSPGPFVWSANYGTNTVSKFNATTGAFIGTYPGGGTGLPHGMSVDFDGFVWLVSNNASAQKQMSKYNPANGALIGSYSIGFLASDAAKYPWTGPGTGAYDDPATPYLYSDFTGVQIDRQAPYTYVGSWDAVHDGGTAQIPWTKVAWNGEPQGAVPTHTSLTVSARAADTMAALGQAPYVAVTNGAALTSLKGRYVQVRADLSGPGWVTAVLSDLTVTGPCGTLSDSCCVLDADCSDGNACSADTCPTPGGACVHTPIPNCCNTDNDCNDSNACTSDACPGAGTQCTHAPVAGCCNSNSDCGDGDLCTADICSGQGGTCLHPLINGCCNTDLDCTKGNLCSSATCPTAGGFCQGGMIPGCCNADADCTDTDLCTLDTCNLTTSTCANSHVAGCCNVDTDCDDNNTCTSDHCTGKGGICAFTPVPGCCSPTDPKVGTPCDVPVSPNDQPPCKSGMWQCSAGLFVCGGSIKPSIDICDGIDNNCDGILDSPPPCPTGQACVTGVCVAPCKTSGEFPCGSTEQCVDGYCMPTTCDKVVCPAGQVCVGGLCSLDGGTSSSSSSSGGTGGSGTSSSGATGGSGTSSSGGTGGHGGAASSSSSSSSGKTTSEKGTCGCEVVGSPDADRTPGALALLAVALGAAGVRRRRAARAAKGVAR